jgi:hypothetical protein
MSIADGCGGSVCVFGLQFDLRCIPPLGNSKGNGAAGALAALLVDGPSSGAGIVVGIQVAVVYCLVPVVFDDYFVG